MRLEIVTGENAKIKNNGKNRAKKLISTVLSVALLFQAICTVPVFAEAVKGEPPQQQGEEIKKDEPTVVEPPIIAEPPKEEAPKGEAPKDEAPKDENTIVEPPKIGNNLLGEIKSPTDLTNNVTVKAIVKQDGKEITGNTLEFGKDISVVYSFSVYGKGSAPEALPKPNDTDFVIINLPEKLVLRNNTTQKLMAGTTEIGAVTFANATGGAKYATAKVVFNSVLIADESIDSEVPILISALMKYDSSATGDTTPGNKTITILGKDYIIQIPENPTTITVVKAGVANVKTKVVDWTVTVTPKFGNMEKSLKDYVFTDDLTSVGEYVTDSFKLNSVSPSPTPIYGADKILTYTFPDDGDIIGLNQKTLA